jgi:hypothetical protein
VKMSRREMYIGHAKDGFREWNTVRLKYVRPKFEVKLEVFGCLEALIRDIVVYYS